MLANVRIAHTRAVRPILASHRRLLATPPPNYPVPTSPVAPPTSQTPQPTTTTLPPPTLPPPSTAGLLPPPPPPRGRRTFRRFLFWTAFGVLTFYPLSGWLSTQYEGYRDFFTGTFPLGEAVADYADDHNWETFGVGTVSKKAAQALQRAKGEGVVPGSTKEEAANKFRELQAKAESGAKKAENEVKSTFADLEARAKTAVNTVTTKAAEAKDAVVKKTKEETLSLREGASNAANKVKKQTVSLREDASDVADKAKKQAVSLREDASDVADKAKKQAVSLREDASDVADKAKKEAVSLRERASDAAESVKAKAVDAVTAAKANVEETASAVKSNVVSAGNKVEKGAKDVVREAEDALKKGERKVEDAAKTVKAKVDETPGPKGYLDAQRPRELRPETVTPAKPTYEGQTVYKGTLPVGHEPPPGYYIPPPVTPKVKEPAEKVKETLPLLAPKVKEFATEEPIVTQLASTIDSLTSSLSAPNSGDSTKILSKAQDDLNALTQRLSDVKKAEKAKLEKTVGEKVKEFEQVLKAKEQERAQGEQGLKQNWEKEKTKLVDDWHKELEAELESQRQGIEQRLREEVVSQGIELQRRWLRSIKSQVETERGGRLAKLDSLTTSLKQLERITLDNSASLDDNVRLHKVWSALRAVQAKAEAGDASFDDELRLLRSLSVPTADAPESVVSVTLEQLDKSGIAQTGVKSFAALASWFSNSVSPRVHSAALVPAPEEATVLSHVASAVFSKVMFAPKAGVAEGDDVSSTLARAELCLGEKDLDGAAREVNSLKGWPAKLAEDWLREARRRLEVEQALEIVGAEATLGSLLLV